MIHDQIKADLKPAMLAKEAEKVGVLRGLLAAFTNELVAKKRRPDDKLEDEEALAVIRRAAKQRQDAIDQFTTGGRPELAEGEQAELAIIQTYLPAQMSEAEVEPIVKAKIAQLGVTDKKEMGKLIGALMKDLKDKADGAVVKKVVEKLLN